MVISPFSSFANAFTNGSAGTNPAAAIAALNGTNLGGASSTQQLTGQAFPGFQSNQFLGTNGFTPQNLSVVPFPVSNGFAPQNPTLFSALQPQLTPQFNGQLFGAQNPNLAFNGAFPNQLFSGQNSVLGLDGSFTPQNPFVPSPNGGFLPGSGFPNQNPQAVVPGAGTTNNINITHNTFNFTLPAANTGLTQQALGLNGNPFQQTGNGQAFSDQVGIGNPALLQSGGFPAIGYGQTPLPLSTGQPTQPQNPFMQETGNAPSKAISDDQGLSLFRDFMSLFSQFMNMVSSRPQNNASNGGAGTYSSLYPTSSPLKVPFSNQTAAGY